MEVGMGCWEKGIGLQEMGGADNLHERSTDLFSHLVYSSLHRRLYQIKLNQFIYTEHGKGTILIARYNYGKTV